MSWEKAAAHAAANAEPEVLPSGIVLPPTPAASGARTSRVIVADHFDPTMIDMSIDGARIVIRPLSRGEAHDIYRSSNPDVYVSNERSQTFLEKELQMDPTPRPQVGRGVSMLVIQQVRWNDIRYFFIEYESDANGCIE